MHSLCPAVWSKQRKWLCMSMICLSPLACVSVSLRFCLLFFYIGRKNTKSVLVVFCILCKLMYLCLSFTVIYGLAVSKWSNNLYIWRGPIHQCFCTSVWRFTSSPGPISRRHQAQFLLQGKFLKFEGVNTCRLLSSKCSNHKLKPRAYEAKSCVLFFLQTNWGTSITPTLQWPDKSFTMGLAQPLAWKRSGLMYRPTVQLRLVDCLLHIYYPIYFAISFTVFGG